MTQWNFWPIVEVDWLSNGTWTNVTRYVRDENGISITRGRGDEQSDIQTSAMSLTFNNDGRFTPGLATGANYPNVKKNKPIRVRVVYWSKNQVTNPSFEAGITDWSAAGTVAPALAQSATHVQSGSQALRITWGTGGTGPAAQTTVYGLQVGEVYTASAYVWVTAATPAVRLGAVGLSTGTSSSTTGAFQRITYTFTAADTYAVLQVTPATSPTSGQQCWVDAVQVEAGSMATTFDSTAAAISTRFLGRVNEWPVDYIDGVAQTVSPITCSDMLKGLGKLRTIRSLLEEEFLYLDPDAYYTLGEDSGATSAGDTSGNQQTSMATYQVAGAGGTVTFGDDGGPGPDDLTAVRFAPFSSTQGKGLRADLAAATGTLVVACWLQTTVRGRDFLQVANRFSGIGGAAVVMDVDSGDGTLLVTAFLGDATSVVDFSGAGLSTDLGNGFSHFVAVQIKSDGGVFANVDGVDGSGGFAFGTIIVTDSYSRLVAGGFKDPTGGGSNLFDGVLSHVWYSRRATMPSWANVWSAGNGTAESTTARFTRLCRLLAITGTTKGTSSTQIDPQASNGKAGIQALRDCANVEAGLVYADRSTEVVVFECRNWRYNMASSLTVTSADIRDDLEWSDDDQLLVNDVTNRRDQGADQRAINQASIDAYGTATGGDSLPWATDYDALASAQWAVYKGADPPPRVNKVTISGNLLSSLTAYGTALGLDLSDVLTVTSLPATSPQSSITVHIEGYEENISITTGRHDIGFHTSPTTWDQAWKLGVAGFSELGVTTRLVL